MGSYFADKWNAVSGLPAAIADDPLFFIIAFAIGLPLILWKWRAGGNSVNDAVESLTYGLRADGDHKHTRHDTGIGNKDVLVMRLGKLPKMIYFALFFFGGGALFYLLLSMPSDLSEPSDWWTVLALSAFTLGAMILIEVNQTCIYVDDRSIQERRVLHRRHTIAFSDIARVDLHAKYIVRGMIIHSHNGDKMRVLATFSGYRQLLERLSSHNAQIGLAARLIKVSANA